MSEQLDPQKLIEEARRKLMERPPLSGSGKPDPRDPNDFRMPLIEHLRELRKRVMWSLAFIGGGMGVGFLFATDVFNALAAPVRRYFDIPADKLNDWDRWYAGLTAPFEAIMPHVRLDGALTQGQTPGAAMYVWLEMGMLVGGILASPFVAWQAWQFIAPGLYGTEKRVVFPLALASSALFVTGCAFCYVVVLPLTFPFFMQVLDVKQLIPVDGYVESVIWMMAAFGGAFELPIGVWFLARLGLIDHRDMIRMFRYAIVAISVVAAIFTPPDVLSMMLLMVPLTVLYVASIAVAWAFTRKKREPPAPA